MAEVAPCSWPYLPLPAGPLGTGSCRAPELVLALALSALLPAASGAFMASFLCPLMRLKEIFDQEWGDNHP